MDLMTQDYIFSSKNRYSKQAKATSEVSSIFYTLKGFETTLDSDNNPITDEDQIPKIFAKKTTRNDGTVKYSIRFDKYGKMFNPISIYGNKDLNLLDNISRHNKHFREVGAKVFHMYMNFLQTKNVAWLHNAEREFE
jgi:hypothetical protein